MKKKIKIFIACVGFITFLVLFSSYVSATTETLYHRSDQHTINGLGAYNLNISNSASSTYMEGQFGGGGCAYAHWYSDIYIRHSDESETKIGSNVALVVRENIGEGYQSANWNCPETSLNPTDAIKIVEKVGNLDGSIIFGNRVFITEQLGAIKLNAYTWNFNRYTHFVDCVYAGYWLTTTRLHHGGSSHATRVEGFSYLAYIDCGLRVYNETATQTISCEPAGTLTSPLRIRKGDTTYGIVLVDTTDSSASKIRINTSSGVKALREY